MLYYGQSSLQGRTDYKIPYVDGPLHVVLS
jgi:hypothetical protein